jgi:diazepam-binding inhibitor (GABA receptor modulator, acyl-CoA-binding protein)
MSLQDDFEAAKKGAFQLPNQPPESLLKMYALYKQATSGDASGSRPGAFNFKARAKFDAWAEVKGLSSEDAMTQYVDFVNSLNQ